VDGDQEISTQGVNKRRLFDWGDPQSTVFRFSFCSMGGITPHGTQNFNTGAHTITNSHTNTQIIIDTSLGGEAQNKKKEKTHFDIYLQISKHTSQITPTNSTLSP
jgi:hypothetical protein